MDKHDLKEITRDELAALFRENGFKAIHARKVFKHLYCGVDGTKPLNQMEDFSELQSFPGELVCFLKQRFHVSSMQLKNQQISADGTRKFLFTLSDDHEIETVLIPETSRYTLCVSTQVGCKFGCGFCVSGRGGWKRNLRVAEIVNQVLQVNETIHPQRVSNIVFMGIGEPLDNIDAVIRATSIFTDEKGLYFAKKRISISTCGVVPGIRQLAKERNGIRLSVSLHSAEDSVRTSIMPVNARYPLDQLKSAVQAFTAAEGLPVFFEYIMIDNLNVSPEDAHRLAEYVRDIDCKINLIPYNQSPYFQWRAPGEDTILRFRSILENTGVFYTVRKSRGLDIAAACGQLLTRLQK